MTRTIAAHPSADMVELLRVSTSKADRGILLPARGYGMGELLLALGWYFVFLFSTTFHEAAHAWVAQRGGDLTAYEGGQVSLDPRPHIRREPWGMVVLPLLSV